MRIIITLLFAAAFASVRAVPSTYPDVLHADRSPGTARGYLPFNPLNYYKGNDALVYQQLADKMALAQSYGPFGPLKPNSGTENEGKRSLPVYHPQAETDPNTVRGLPFNPLNYYKGNDALVYQQLADRLALAQSYGPYGPLKPKPGAENVGKRSLPA